MRQWKIWGVINTKLGTLQKNTAAIDIYNFVYFNRIFWCPIPSVMWCGMYLKVGVPWGKRVGLCSTMLNKCTMGEFRRTLKARGYLVWTRSYLDSSIYSRDSWGCLFHQCYVLNAQFTFPCSLIVGWYDYVCRYFVLHNLFVDSLMCCWPIGTRF